MEHLRSACMPGCSWFSSAEGRGGGVSSCPTSCRSFTTLSSCSSFLRTGKHGPLSLLNVDYKILISPSLPCSSVYFLRVFMLLSCIGQRSLSNSGVLEGLLNLLDTLLSPLQQTNAAQPRRTEGVYFCDSGFFIQCKREILIWCVYHVCLCVFIGVLDIPMISWVVMLVSRLLDYVASVEDEASAAKKPLGAKDRERTFTGKTSEKQTKYIENVDF